MMKDKHGWRRRDTRIPEFAQSGCCRFLATRPLRGPRRAGRGAVAVGEVAALTPPETQVSTELSVNQPVNFGDTFG